MHPDMMNFNERRLTWCWFNDEVFRFPFDSREDAITDADESNDPGYVVEVDTCSLLDGKAYLPTADSLLDTMEELLSGNYMTDDRLFDFSTEPEEAESALNKALSEWYDKHVSMSGYYVADGEHRETHVCEGH